MPVKNTQKDFQKQAEEIVKKSHSKKVYFEIAIIFTAIVIGLFIGIAVIINDCKYLGNNKKAINNKITELVDQEIKVARKNQIDTSDWQTYRNEEFGFEFKFPKEYFRYPVGLYGLPEEQEGQFEEFMKNYIITFKSHGKFGGSFDIYNIKELEEQVIKQPISNLQIKTKNKIDYYYFNEKGIIINSDGSFIVFDIMTYNITEEEFFENILSTFKFIEKNKTADSKFENFITDYGVDPETNVRVEMTSPKTMEKNKKSEVKIIISGWDKIGLNLYQSFLSVKNVTKYRLSAEENVSCKQNYGRKECSIFITPLCEWPDKITLYPLIRKSDSLSTSFNIGLSFNISLSSSDSEICDNGIDDDCNGQTDGVDLKCAMFAISVLPGEGLTSLARRAVIQYLEKFYDNSYLNKEQKIYAEDYIKKDLKNEIGTLKSGEKVEFSSSLIEEAIAKSKRLSSDEIDSIGEYKELINYSGYKIISKSESVADVDMVWRIDNDIKEQLEKVRRFKDDTSEAWKVVDSEGSLVVYYQNENIDNVFYLIGAYRENIAVQDYNIAEDLLIHSVELSDNGINWGKGEIFYNNFYNKNVSASGLDGKGAGNFYVDVKDYNKGSLYIRFNLKSYTSGTGITLTKNLKVNLSDADLSEKEKAVIIYPDRSSVLETGETYQIQWKPNDPNRLIDIILNNNTTAYSEDALVWHLRESVPDTGNYFFTVPKNLKIGNKYQFIITQYYHHKIGINTLVSDEFSIMSE